MNKNTNNHMTIFLGIVALQSMAANFAHPITPTIIKELMLPNYMFGVMFAAMAFTNFLFSPFWARMVGRIGSRLTLLICCSGYGFGQLLFMLAKNIPMILAARIVAGFFVGGIMISYLSYLISQNDSKTRGRYLALNATFMSVFGAFGYLIGGFLGVQSLTLTFLLQALLLVAAGVLFYFFLGEDKQVQSKPFRFVKDANPFGAFLDVRHLMSKMLGILFLIVLITSIASTAYDQCFNFYIKDAFQFNSSYNGILKAIVGFISLIANTTICMWIMKNLSIRKSLVYIYMGASICLMFVFFFQDMIPFILMNIVFFVFDAIYVPLLQSLCADQNNNNGKNEVMGFYNAMKSLGMIFGSLFAGFIYVVGPKLSFLCAAILFIVAACLMTRYRAPKVKGLEIK